MRDGIIKTDYLKVQMYLILCVLIGGYFPFIS